MNILFLVYGFVLGILAFVIWKLVTDRPRKDSPLDDYRKCRDCGVLVHYFSAHKRLTKWFFTDGWEEEYFCKAHRPEWDKRDATLIPFRYYKEIEVNEDGSVKYPLLLDIKDYSIMSNRILEQAADLRRDQEMAEEVKKATQKMGKKGLKTKK